MIKGSISIFQPIWDVRIHFPKNQVEPSRPQAAIHGSTKELWTDLPDVEPPYLCKNTSIPTRWTVKAHPFAQRNTYYITRTLDRAFYTSCKTAKCVDLIHNSLQLEYDPRPQSVHSTVVSSTIIFRQTGIGAAHLPLSIFNSDLAGIDLMCRRTVRMMDSLEPHSGLLVFSHSS